MPGLSEMHAHIPSGDADRAYIDDVLFLYLANGITTIRGMPGDPLHLELREQAGQSELVSPRIYASGPGFNGGAFDTPDQARQQVREHVVGTDAPEELAQRPEFQYMPPNTVEQWIKS